MIEKNKVVLGVCRTRADVERAVESLRREGFSTDDISVLAPHNEPVTKIKENSKAPEGAVAGAGAGAIIGGAIGLLAGAGSLVIPGLGPLIAAGPIMAVLAGAGVGGAVGGVGGALVGLGIPEYEAKRYENYVKNGGFLISVHTENSDEVAHAVKCLEFCDATDIYSTDEMAHDEVPRGDWRSATAPFNNAGGVDKGSSGTTR
jgi:uncharacterized membrane protein